MILGPPVHSQLAQCWEDCALLFIYLSGLLSHLPHSSLFPGLLECLLLAKLHAGITPASFPAA